MSPWDSSDRHWPDREQPQNGDWQSYPPPFDEAYPTHEQGTDTPHSGSAAEGDTWSTGSYPGGYDPADPLTSPAGYPNDSQPGYEPTTVFGREPYPTGDYPATGEYPAGGYPGYGDPEPATTPWYLREDAQDPAAAAGPPPRPPRRSAPTGPEPVAQEPVAPRGAGGHGRAGRNLPAAIGVGLTLGGVALAGLYLPIAGNRGLGFVGIVAVAVLLGLWEISHALSATGIKIPVIPLLVGGAAMIAGTYAGGGNALLVTLALTTLAVLAWRMPDGPENFVRDVTASLFAVTYVAFLASFSVLLNEPPEDGSHRVLMFVALTVASDTGGYIAGVFFGRHPLAPRFSPKKSWEGLAGSVLLSALVATVITVLLLDGAFWKGLIIGPLVALAATFGDLVESLIKRDLGVKDMGRLLPGHGGVMDRLDSLLIVAPVTWLLLTLLLPPA